MPLALQAYRTEPLSMSRREHENNHIMQHVRGTASGIRTLANEQQVEHQSPDNFFKKRQDSSSQALKACTLLRRII